MGKLSHLKKAVKEAKRRVYQGSPHKYDGKLDHSKIGTGEGAQAYGYGHYLAENPSVAKQYQGALSYKELVNNFRKDLPDDAGFDELLEMAQSGKFTDYQNDVIKALADDDWLGFDYPSQAITAAFRDLDNYDPSPALRRAIEGSGHFYEFDLPESAIDNMLDWDAPLSEQSERIQDAISKARDSIRKLSPEYADNMDITGEGLYQLYREYRGGSSQAASEGLKELGIPGIKYHDGMSRAAGEGTRNFVIFPGNEDMVKAVSRNGEKLSAAALAPLAGIGLMGTFSEDAEAGKFRAVIDAAVNTTKRATDGYSTGHIAPYRDAEGYHSSLDDVTNMFGDDIYTANAKRYYGGDNAADEAIDIIQRHKGDPDALIDIYRAAPEGVSEFNSGDWVTISQDYARQHGDSHISGDYNILKGQAKASDLFNEGYATEWGLDPAKKNSADLLASVGGAGVLGAAALSPEDARAAELDAIALHGEAERGWRPTEKRNKWKQFKQQFVEPLGTIASSLASLPVSGLEGLGALAQGYDIDDAVGAMERRQAAMTYVPGSETGRQSLANIGEAMEILGEAPPVRMATDALDHGADVAYRYGSKVHPKVGAALGATVKTLPEVVF